MAKSNQEQRRQMLLRDPIPKVVIKMALPTIVAFLINAIYSLADTYFVSGISEEAVAAVGVNSILDQLIMMAGSLLALGANSYIARLLGQNNDKKASHVLSTAFFLAMGAGALLTAVGVAFMDPMVELLGAEPAFKQHSIDYASYVLLAAPFMTSSFVMNQCLRSEGSATFSMIGMGLGGIINCILDPIFIFGLDLGVAGASMATAISKVISFLILLAPYVLRKSLLHLSIRNIRFKADIFKEMISVGSSSMFRSGLAVVAGIMLNQLAGDFPEDISTPLIAGIGVSTKVLNFPFFIILGFCTGFQPVAGFNWGAKRYDRVRQSYKFASIVSVIGAVVMSVLFILFVDPLISLFSEAGAPNNEFGKICIITQCIALPVHSWVATLNMLCAGLGNAKGAFLLATSRQGSCFIPLLFPLSALFGAFGLCYVQAGADILSLVLAVPIAIYMTKKIRNAEKELIPQ